MSEQRTYSLNQIARKLNVPASTLRYWKDNTFEFMDYVQKGRAKRYTEQSLQVLTRVKELKEQDMDLDDIKQVLIKEFPLNVDAQTTSNQAGYEQAKEVTHQGEGTKNPINEDNLKLMFKQLYEQNQELHERVEQLEKNVEQKLEKRDEELMNAIRAIQEQKEEEKKPWWKKIFKRE